MKVDRTKTENSRKPFQPCRIAISIIKAILGLFESHSIFFDVSRRAGSPATRALATLNGSASQKQHDTRTQTQNLAAKITAGPEHDLRDTHNPCKKILFFINSKTMTLINPFDNHKTFIFRDQTHGKKSHNRCQIKTRSTMSSAIPSGPGTIRTFFINLTIADKKEIFLSSHFKTRDGWYRFKSGHSFQREPGPEPLKKWLQAVLPKNFLFSKKRQPHINPNKCQAISLI